MKDRPCPLCDDAKLKNDSWIAVRDLFPVGIGHMILMPVRHDATLFSLTDTEQDDLFKLLRKVKNYLDESLGEHKPDGYNIGVNVGEAAGQTIAHLHVHVIPRYFGDVENPRGGIRNLKKALISW